MAGLVAAVIVAAVTAFGTGVGESLWLSTKPEPKLLTASDEEEELSDCGAALFISGAPAARVARGGKDKPIDWIAFKQQFSAVTGYKNVVAVSVQGESARTVTLTRFDVEVDRKPRPSGAMFVNPCGGPIVGRSLQVDLDQTPPRVFASTEEPEGVAEATDPETGRSLYKPIRFPWTVSVTDPLILRVVAWTKRCYCVWRGNLTWRSGDKGGVIRIDNDGKGYRVIGPGTSPIYEPGKGGWKKW